MNRFCQKASVLWLCLPWLCIAGLPSCGHRSQSPATDAKNQTDLGSPAATDPPLSSDGDEPNKTDTPSSTTSVSTTANNLPHSEEQHAALGITNAQPAWEPRGDWTTQRLIVLAEGGPCLIDLSVNLEGKSLEQAADEQQAAIAQELLADLDRPAQWEDLLKLPLVRSGWLGNLIPDDQQREQLISLVDTQRDGIVDDKELPAFLSRGLSRVGPLQMSDLGYGPDHDSSQSPWGKGDRNQDFSLDSSEREGFVQALAQQDLNGDGVLTRRELAGTMLPMPNMSGSNRGSMLRTTSLMFAESSVTTSESNSSAKNSTHPQTAVSSPTPQLSSKPVRKLASDVLRHYTFLAELSREQWPNWSDQQWSTLDTNQNQQLDSIELQLLVTCPPQARLYVTLTQPLSPSGQEPQVNVQVMERSTSWRASDTGGQLTCGSCSMRVELTDAFAGPGKMQLRQQLTQALKSPQLQAFFVNRLQLDAAAFELLDQDQDESLSDQEFERVWRWISSRQSARLVGRWTLTGQPWFQLADDNADARLSELELQGFSHRLAEYDRNGDTQLTPNELPLVAALAIVRSDSRLDNFLAGAGAMSAPAVDSDWFSAMDTNRDGSVNSAEFLGEADDFFRFDINQDGFLSRGEVYFPKTSN